MNNEIKGVSGIETAVAQITKALTERLEEVKAELSPFLHGVVTEETVSQWKKDRAKINAEKGASKKERISIEAEWKAHLGPISDAYKAIDDEYQKALDNIDSQTREFELARIRQKQEHIRELWDEIQPPEEIAGWLVLDAVYSVKWENATTTDKQIRKEMADAVTALKISYDTLVSLHHKWQEEGLAELRRTYDLQMAINKMNSLAEQEKIIEQKRVAATQADFSTVEDKTPVEDEELPFGAPEPLMLMYVSRIPADRLEEYLQFCEYLGVELEYKGAC